jgi:hypothetical protein
VLLAASVELWRCALLDWLMSVAAAGGSAFVGAAATDAWQGARNGMVRLFGRGGQRRRDAAERWADQTATVIEQAPENERTAIRERLAVTWQQRLADLVEEYPELSVGGPETGRCIGGGATDRSRWNSGVGAGRWTGFSD